MLKGLSTSDVPGRLWRLSALVVAVAPGMRWVIIRHAVPAGQPWQRACPRCQTEIGPLNWGPLWPTARCARCRYRLGPPPWSVEIVLAVVTVAVAWANVPTWVLPAYVWWAGFGVVLSFVDLAVRRLPNRLTWPAAVGFLTLAGPAAWHGYAGAWLRAACGALLLLVLLGVCALVRPGWVGRGDMKYGAAIGAAAGWASWFALYASLFVATLLGAVVGVVLIVAGKASRRSHLPLGPFLFAGTLTVVLQSLR